MCSHTRGGVVLHKNRVRYILLRNWSRFNTVPYMQPTATEIWFDLLLSGVNTNGLEVYGLSSSNGTGIDHCPSIEDCNLALWNCTKNVHTQGIHTSRIHLSAKKNEHILLLFPKMISPQVYKDFLKNHIPIYVTMLKSLQTVLITQLKRGQGFWLIPSFQGWKSVDSSTS